VLVSFLTEEGQDRLPPRQRQEALDQLVAGFKQEIQPSKGAQATAAVVQLADYPDMTVYLDNQPVGRTDRRGRVLLDSLQPYETNTVSVDPLELPFDASLATTAMTVTPAYRSGPVVQFPVTRASAATLRLVQPDGTPVPAGARVTTAREQVPVARNGLVYLTSAAGRQRAMAQVVSFDRALGIFDIGSGNCGVANLQQDVVMHCSGLGRVQRQHQKNRNHRLIGATGNESAEDALVWEPEG